MRAIKFLFTVGFAAACIVILANQIHPDVNLTDAQGVGVFLFAGWCAVMAVGAGGNQSDEPQDRPPRSPS